MYLLLGTEAFCDSRKQIFVFFDLIRGSLLNAVVHVYLKEMLVEDAILGEFLVVRDLGISDLLVL